MYRRFIDLAPVVVDHVSREDLKTDIGWGTNNPIREFDLFLVKFGQKPETEFGIVRTLVAEPGIPGRCQDRG